MRSSVHTFRVRGPRAIARPPVAVDHRGGVGEMTRPPAEIFCADNGATPVNVLYAGKTNDRIKKYTDV